ncbi:MAG TPA: hypothetical protein VI893_04185, partial [Thermoplasmata archaeon]|nr:hypothetical protein [Thermoplasmata archaeon]
MDQPMTRSDSTPSDFPFSTSLSFGSATFDPLDPNALAQLDRLATEGLNDRSEGIVPMVVQFHLPVPAGTTDRLIASGFTVLPHYSREGGFIVLAAADSTSELAALPGARWAGEYLPALKFEYAEDIPTQGQTQVVVSTFPSTGGVWKLVSVAQANRARVLQIDDHPFWGGYAIIEGEATFLRSLARLPYVDTIEPYVPAVPIPIIVEKSPSGADLLNGQAS